MVLRRLSPSTPPLAAGIAAVLLAACSGDGGDADTTPPTVPAGLTATPTSTTAVVLSWSAATDAVGVTGYEVLRDGAIVLVTAGTTANDAGLASATRYCWAVRAFDAAGNRSASSPDACATTSDVVPPSVVDTFPLPGAGDVATTAVITATFDEPLDPATLQGGGFTLVRDDTDEIVPAVVTWDEPSLTAGLTAPLQELVGYTAVVGTAVTDVAGNHLVAEVTWTFSIAQRTLHLVGTTPAPGTIDVAPRTVFTASFDEAVDVATLQGGGFTLRDDDAALGVPADVTCDDPCLPMATCCFTATLKPRAPLANLATYTATVTTAATAVSGHPLGANVSWSVRVAPKQLVLQPAAGGAFGAPCGATRIAFADLDKDGHVDAAFVCGDTRVWVALGDGAGGFGPATGVAIGPPQGYSLAAVNGVAAADLDGDGYPDLAVTEQVCVTSGDCQVDGFVDVVLNQGATGPGTFGAPARLAAGQYPMDVVAADLDGDGNTDLASVARWSNRLSVFLATGSGQFAAAVPYDAFDPVTLVAARLRPGGPIDLVSSGGPVLLGDGSGAFGAGGVFEPGSFPMDIAAADIDGDGDNELVVANDATDHVTLLHGDEKGGFPNPSTLTTGRLPGVVEIADLNGDRRPDLLVALHANGLDGTNTTVVLPGVGVGAFGTPVDLHARPFAVVDLDGDGRPDLVGTSFSERQGGYVLDTWLNVTPP
jgi:chitodextrinase